MWKFIALALIGGMIGGCATQPASINGAYVSPNKYNDIRCPQIAADLQGVDMRVDELYGNLDFMAEEDFRHTIVALVLPPVALAVSGGDGPAAMEYAHLRGLQDALNEEWWMKNCDSNKSQTAEEIYQSAFKSE